MTWIDEPTAMTPPTASLETKIVLPRPNLEPEPWSEPAAGFGLIELSFAATGAILVLSLAIRRWRRRLKTRLVGGPVGSLDTGVPIESTPNRRLIVSSVPFRAALIAEFGPSWGSRTTEEIANDPGLIERLGPPLADEVVAYLRRVDLAKFAEDESGDADEWVENAGALLGRFPQPGRGVRRSV